MSAARAFARYDESSNCLVVVRAAESIERRIKCTNLSPGSFRVYGLEIDGDAIDVLVGPKASRRPDRRFRYFFSSLRGGSSHPL